MSSGQAPASPIAFIIMQIGNAELDRVCGSVLVPALKNCGLDPKRVDKHNQGGVLKAEIMAFIEAAEIIVADLTNERPNCYLEVGYALGARRNARLILTAREDHLAEHPDHRPGGPRIHFDVAGYDILFWNPDRLEEFRAELEKRIRRRLASMSTGSNPATVVPWDADWLNEQRQASTKRLAEVQAPGVVEVRFALSPRTGSWSHKALREAVAAAKIRTGWPFAVLLDKHGPQPRSRGIVAEVPGSNGSYDYWALSLTGDFYLAATLEEDLRGPGDSKVIYFNRRIDRTTEALLYCCRLYRALGVDSETAVHVAVRYGGLAGRTLASRACYEPAGRYGRRHAVPPAVSE